MKNLIYIAIIIFAVVLIFGGNDDSSSTSTTDSSRDNSTMAYVQAQNFVKSVLKSPSSAEFPFSGSGNNVGDDTYKVTSYVDSQNSFGAMIRNEYSITLKYTGGDSADQRNWEVKEFIFDGETLVENKNSEAEDVQTAQTSNETEGNQVAEESEPEPVEVGYRIIEEEDISYAGCKRLAVRTVVPDDANEQDVEHTLYLLARDYLIDWDDVTVWAWGYSEEDQVGSTAATKGMVEESLPGLCN